MADDGETFRTDFVHGVLRSVPVTLVYIVVQVDNIDGRNSFGQKWIVVVTDRPGFRDKDILITELCGGRPYQIGEPGRGCAFFGNAKALLTDHVEEDYGLDVLGLA